MGVYTITGGAGFIGSHLADALLEAGHDVRVLDDLSTGHLRNLDRRCLFVRGDVRDQDCVHAAMKGADGCFHLAAIASVERGNQDWLGTHTVNQTGTITVLDTSRSLGGIPVVYASSAAVYGDAGENRIHEGRPPCPQSAYGADKLGSELHARVAFAVHGVPSVGCRFFNVYGPRQDPGSPYSGVISIFARRATERRKLIIHGDGAQTRDFVFVADVVAHLKQAMMLLHHCNTAKIINVCTGHPTAVLDLAHAICKAAGQQQPRISYAIPRIGDIQHSVGDPTVATSLLGLAAEVTLANGLKQLSMESSLIVT